MVVQHAVNMNIFNGDYTEMIDYLTGELMNEVPTFPSNALIYSGDNLTSLFPFRGSFFSLRQLTLCFNQYLFFPSEELWVLNMFTS